MTYSKQLSRTIKALIFDAFIIALQIGGVGRTYAGPFQPLLDSLDDRPLGAMTDKEILRSSQISYRAEGGFTGVASYGVILSCINGQVSVMKSIYDPRLPADKANSREISSMDPKDYIRLWENLDRHALFKMQDAPEPRMDIADEFTVHFYAKVENKFNQFHVYGISRPEAARYFAFRKLIDDSVQMQTLWDTHAHYAQNLDSPNLSAGTEN
jgi:hypothetical protein